MRATFLRAPNVTLVLPSTRYVFSVGFVVHAVSVYVVTTYLPILLLQYPCCLFVHFVEPSPVVNKSFFPAMVVQTAPGVFWWSASSALTATRRTDATIHPSMR